MSDRVLAFAEIAQQVPHGLACTVAFLALTAIPLAVAQTWKDPEHE